MDVFSIVKSDEKAYINYLSVQNGTIVQTKTILTENFLDETEEEIFNYIANIIKNDFEKDLKNFSVSQGKVFTKLIDRETGHSSYELIKELRGSLKAFFWQNFALLFGQNLKSEYDPNGEDVVIESIVRQIEEGKLQY